MTRALRDTVAGRLTETFFVGGGKSAVIGGKNKKLPVKGANLLCAR